MIHHLTAQDIRYGHRQGITPWDLCASRSYNTDVRVGLWEMRAEFPLFRGHRSRQTPYETFKRLKNYIDTGFVEEHTWSDDPDDWWRTDAQYEPEAEGVEGPTAGADEDLEAVWTHPGRSGG